MSRDRDGFDDGRDEGAGWQEPAHLGEGGSRPAGGERSGWEPPGWSLPPAEDRAVPGDRAVPETPPASAGEVPPADGRRERDVLEPDTPEPNIPAGPWGWPTAQEWAVRHGWTVGAGTAPEDTVLRELIATAPARRIGKDALPAGVIRGRAGTLDLVGFDVVYDSGRRIDVVYAVTAAPVLTPLPRMRLSPARLWKHGVGGMVQLPSGDEEFDRRWVLLTEQDTPELRRLVADPTLRGLLLASDDGDEFWTGAGHVAAIRPGKHLAPLVEHHARLLGALLGALAGV